MAKQLFARITQPVRDLVHPHRPQGTRRRLPAAAGAVILALALVALAAAVAPGTANCQLVCQCWYCADYEWGDFDGDGASEFRCNSPCDQGCAGACTGAGRCEQVAGTGGCGPVCSCRGSDCTGGSEPPGNPPPLPPPQPPPNTEECPPPGVVRDWVEIHEPGIDQARYRPDHPVVVEQDPDRQGFALRIVGKGGRYEHKTQRLERVCDDQPEPINGTPQPCRAWHYECPIRCPECYDDPFQAIQIRMRLADSTVEWFRGDLSQRYTGAESKEGLPRVWQLAGVTRQMRVDQWWTYAPGRPDATSNGPLDPGVHGGLIVGWTTGTPKSPPQLVQRPFEVPVDLLDTTIAE